MLRPPNCSPSDAVGRQRPERLEFALGVVGAVGASEGETPGEAPDPHRVDEAGGWRGAARISSHPPEAACA